MHLRRSDRASGSLERGRIWYLTFRVERDGIPVEDALVTFRLNSGNLVQFGSARIVPGLADVPVVPVLSAEEALEATLLTLAVAFTDPEEEGEPPAETTPVRLEELFDPRKAVQAKSLPGGTAPEAVRASLEAALGALDAD